MPTVLEKPINHVRCFHVFNSPCRVRCSLLRGLYAALTPPNFRRTIVSSMSANFEAAFGRVKELVADFRANETFYLSPAYQEQEARRDFIDKFWLALGWDVNHETQKNPFEQEVKVERREHGFSQQSDKDKDFYTNRCDGLDRQIDALVYDLYALTPAEIKIVEGH